MNRFTFAIFWIMAATILNWVGVVWLVTSGTLDIKYSESQQQTATVAPLADAFPGYSLEDIRSKEELIAQATKEVRLSR